MAKEKNETETTEKSVKKPVAVDAQAFIQNKLQTLNQKNGVRYERDAARVVQNNQ
ncbi:hypothetical protein [Enterococcus larvae]|uniref:hypothetical protein n=1 Tax=Enterococcus larvae TaxID=2794352 RepID=UPI003F332D23